MNRLLLMLMMMSLLIACGDDDEDDGASDSLIVGEWNLVSHNYTGKTLSEAEGYSNESNFTGVAQSIVYTMTFAENPNNWTTVGGYDIDLTTIVEASQVAGLEIPGYTDQQTISFPSETSTGSWNIDGDILTGYTTNSTTAGVDPVEGEYTITELTETNLTITYEFNRVQSQSGSTITTDTDGTIVFERI